MCFLFLFPFSNLFCWVSVYICYSSLYSLFQETRKTKSPCPSVPRDREINSTKRRRISFLCSPLTQSQPPYLDTPDSKGLESGRTTSDLTGYVLSGVPIPILPDRITDRDWSRRVGTQRQSESRSLQPGDNLGLNGNV